MSGKDILHKMKVRAGLGLCVPDIGKGKSRASRRIDHGYHLVKGKRTDHVMEDCLVCEFKKMEGQDLGLFAIFDGHMGHNVSNYLKKNLFGNILKEDCFLSDPTCAIKKAYRYTDSQILNETNVLGKGGSTAVTAILINEQKLIVANVGDSRAVICKNGTAIQLSIDHEPAGKERENVERRGGFVSNLPGDVPRVDGQLAVARAFGDKSLKKHLSSEPDVTVVLVDDDTEFFILASDGLWKVVSNQEAVACIRYTRDAKTAARHLVDTALSKKSKDDISCIVVRF